MSFLNGTTPLRSTPLQSPANFPSDAVIAPAVSTFRPIRPKNPASTNPDQVIQHATVLAENERLESELDASYSKVAAMERELSELRARPGYGPAPGNERSQMMQAMREIQDRARSMQMERDGWKAEADRLTRMTQMGTEALLGERNYLISECQRLSAENTAIRTKAEEVTMRHMSSVRDYTANMTTSANTIKQLRSEMANLVGTVGVKKESESELQQRLTETESTLQQQREELQNALQALETTKTAHERLRGAKMMVDLEAQESRKQLEKAKTTLFEVRTELESLQAQPPSGPPTDELETARRTIENLAAQLAVSKALVESLQEKPTAGEGLEKTREELETWRKDCLQTRESLVKEIAAKKQLQTELEEAKKRQAEFEKAKKQLRAEFDKARKQQQAELDTTKKQLKALKAESEEAKKQLQADDGAKKQQQAEFDATKKQLQDAIDAAKMQLWDEDGTKKQLQADFDATKKQLQAEIDEGAKNLESVLERQEELRLKHESTLVELEKMKRAVFENDGELRQLRALQASAEKETAQSKSKLEEVKDEHKWAISKLKEDHQREIAKVTEGSTTGKQNTKQAQLLAKAKEDLEKQKAQNALTQNAATKRNQTIEKLKADKAEMMSQRDKVTAERNKLLKEVEALRKASRPVAPPPPVEKYPVPSRRPSNPHPPPTVDISSVPSRRYVNYNDLDRPAAQPAYDRFGSSAYDEPPAAHGWGAVPNTALTSLYGWGSGPMAQADGSVRRGSAQNAVASSSRNPARTGANTVELPSRSVPAATMTLPTRTAPLTLTTKALEPVSMGLCLSR